MSYITYFYDLEQGSQDWLDARRGVITASEMKYLITPTLKVASNDKERSHMYELAAQRISGFVEPRFVSDDMMRGHDDEVEARELYREKVDEVQKCGFMTNNRFGFKIGFSPDGLVGDDGLIEVKSRLQKFQVQTIAEAAAGIYVPHDYMLQIQTGLLVSERKWCDFISFCAGLPMLILRVYPDEKIQAAIVDAARVFEAKIVAFVSGYKSINPASVRTFPTERKIIPEMFS